MQATDQHRRRVIAHPVLGDLQRRTGADQRLRINRGGVLEEAAACRQRVLDISWLSPLLKFTVDLRDEPYPRVYALLVAIGVGLRVVRINIQHQTAMTEAGTLRTCRRCEEGLGDRVRAGQTLAAKIAPST
jgi:hypothetical protein